MKQIEKVAVVRVIHDLILADGILDTREMDLLDRLYSDYGVKKTEILLADECTLAEALNVLSEADEDLRRKLLNDCMLISMSDNICAREEAMLMLALRSCLTQNMASRDSVISVRGNQRINLEPFQVLYVESEYDEEVNASIGEQYREICTELRLTGFDFVYLPQIACNYQKMSDEELLKLGYFLYPQVSDERLRVIIMQLRELSTARFCREQLSMKLDFKGLVDVAPSILFKINESLVDNEQVSNFMLLEISDNALDTVREMIDLFNQYHQNSSVRYLREESGRFIVCGIHKQIFDILMLRKGIRSRVVIDPANERIFFADADVELEKVHRREKALYTLLLLESASGGVNFSRPTGAQLQRRHEQRMQRMQEKYALIYRMFGGSSKVTPSLANTESRSPMLSLLKRQLMSLRDILHSPENYVADRNIYGNYAVSISPDLICYYDAETESIHRLDESEEWRRILSL